MGSFVARPGDILSVVLIRCMSKACISTGLSWATGTSAPHLEHLPPFFYTYLGTCRVARVTHLTRLSQLLLHCSFSLFSVWFPRAAPSIIHSSALAAAIRFWSSWSWLWSDVGQFWVLLTEATLVFEFGSE